MAEREYHWIISYTVPGSVGSVVNPDGRVTPLTYDVRQRNGVCTVEDGETRRDVFERIARDVAEDDRLSLDQFTVTFFSLEPNRLDDGPGIEIGEMHIREEADIAEIGRRFAKDFDFGLSPKRSIDPYGGLDARQPLDDGEGEGPEMQLVGYIVVKTDEDGSNPEYCVHGPDPVETRYPYAYDWWKGNADDPQPGRRYVLCQLVPVEPVEPGGDPDERRPFDWARADQRVADGRLTDPAWIAVHVASGEVRHRLGIAGSMAAARDIAHPFTPAVGDPYDQAPPRLDHLCAACGCIRALIAHKVVG